MTSKDKQEARCQVKRWRARGRYESPEHHDGSCGADAPRVVVYRGGLAADSPESSEHVCDECIARMPEGTYLRIEEAL